jgi:pimeloyl-ACP methyl ester carboxylesterase
MGESQRVRGLDAGLEASADRVAACMDALEIPQADVAGHSHGGAIAMMLAARHPARVRSLILFAPANPFCKAALPWVRFYMSPVGKATALVMPFVPKLVHIRAMHRMYGDPARVTEEHFAGYKTQLDLGCVRHVLGILRSWRSDMQQLERAMHQLATVPTLLIWGELDSAVSPRSGQRLAEVLGARLVVLPGVGHVAFAERPELCNPLFGEWMSRPDAA